MEGALDLMRNDLLLAHYRRLLERYFAFYAPVEAQRNKLERMMRLTVRMDALLDSLLHFSRVGRMALDMEGTDLNSVVAEALEMVDARRLERACDISVAGVLPCVTCDRVRVREIFVNLLSNALKYNDKPVCSIEIGCDSAARPVVYVKDNGIGIAQHHVEQIFKMFRRLHGRDDFGGGNGTGLTIVKKTCRAPRRPRVGALDAGAGHDVFLYSQRRSCRADMSITRDIPHIVLVEDSDDDHDTVREAVRLSGLSARLGRVGRLSRLSRLTRMSNGDECLALLRHADTERPMLVLMDLSTPGTDGREALREIKADPLLKTIPVVVVTASANPRDVNFCYGCGANAYHVKPVRYPEHLQMLAGLLKYWLVDVLRPAAPEVSP